MQLSLGASCWCCFFIIYPDGCKQAVKEGKVKTATHVVSIRTDDVDEELLAAALKVLGFIPSKTNRAYGRL